MKLFADLDIYSNAGNLKTPSILRQGVSKNFGRIMDTQHIGTQIRKVRKSLKITQKQLATMSGLHLKTITNLEKGNTINPKVDTI
ncbi:MAG: helix-turn-helix transcriptional regulator [Fulvivirga sp.]|uniref:helix-turn-helix domain-containing protein n=1 Tax=Fulvivirga sp. TaxID=1931237 RepID=UPI0032EAD3A9